MASEHIKCNAGNSIINTDESETEQIATGTHFVDINDLLKREIKEETTEFESFSEYGLSNECLEKLENEQFFDPDSNEFEVARRHGVKDSKESKFSPTDLWENTELNDLAGVLAKPKVNHFKSGVILKKEYEEHPENIDLLANSAGLKTETFKTEHHIDVFYENVKPEIHVEKPDKIIGTEIGRNYSHEFLKDSKTWPQQNIEENGTTVDTRMESTIRINSNNSQTNEYPKLYPSETKKGHLTGHERIHMGEKLFPCKVCSKSFAAKKSLLRHERMHTGEKPFQCKICLKSFSRKGCLTEHERIHTGEKPFQCKVCLKSFTVKYTLVHHERMHTGEKPFKCKICLKSFPQKVHLTDHNRIHTGEKPFQCQICLKSFSQVGHLRGHDRIHTGEKPFQCKVCLKSFSLKGNLKGHERIHTGEKPFLCQVCPKSFVLKNSLLFHERIHTEEK